MTPKRSMPLWLAIHRKNETDYTGGQYPFAEVLLDMHIRNKTKRLRHPRTTKRNFKGRHLLKLAVQKMKLRWSKG